MFWKISCSVTSSIFQVFLKIKITSFANNNALHYNFFHFSIFIEDMSRQCLCLENAQTRRCSLPHTFKCMRQTEKSGLNTLICMSLFPAISLHLVIFAPKFNAHFCQNAKTLSPNQKLGICALTLQNFIFSQFLISSYATTKYTSSETSASTTVLLLPRYD